jgi:predicted NBD/HSP70 family sugar kinase
MKGIIEAGFTPLFAVYQQFQIEAGKVAKTEEVQIACVRDGGDCDVFSMNFASPLSDDAIRFCERIVKFILWASGGYEVHIAGPSAVSDYVKGAYVPTGTRAFDCEMMQMAYDKPLTVIVTTPDKLPKSKVHARALGGHLKGCSLGFDLGASDFKISALKDGETVFADEFPWVPVTAPDPNYHFNMLQAGLKKAASYLPRVDVIGGSSAGIIVDNQIKFASLIRGIKGDDRVLAQHLFKRVQDAWKVPVEVVNDGDVTALAGAMSFGSKAILGIAMGSSEAVGFIDREGHLTGRLSELAFAPVDFNPKAPQDEWSKDVGVGAMYFSQQAVNYLALKVGFVFPSDMPLPERLKVVQAAMAKDDPKAAEIYTTIGVYLGWSMPWYRLFYDYDTILLLGRVTSGKGGEIIVHTALETLAEIAPALVGKLKLLMPDEKARRVGQCVAAASLPADR